MTVGSVICSFTYTETVVNTMSPYVCRGPLPTPSSFSPLQKKLQSFANRTAGVRTVSKQVLRRIFNDHSKLLKNGPGFYANSKTGFVFFYENDY